MIKPLENNYISDVARIHKQELSGFLPELGIDFLSEFYKTGLSIDEIFIFIDEDFGTVKGFVCNITEAEGLYKAIIFRSPIKFFLLFLKYFITHPQKIIKFLKIFAYPGFAEGGAELLSIAVDRKFQRKGIGRKLFRKSRQEFIKRGITKFRIGVYDRLSANEFYHKMDCRRVKSFDFMSEKMNYYECNV